MRFTVRLTRVLNERNARLIARRLSGDLAKDLKMAEALLLQLPVEVARGVTEEKANTVLFEYERLGCLMEKEAEWRLPEDSPRPREESPVPAVGSSTAAGGGPPADAPPGPLGRRFGFSSGAGPGRPPAGKLRGKRAQWAAFAAVILIALSYFATRSRRTPETGADSFQAPVPSDPSGGLPAGDPEEDILRLAAEAESLQPAEVRIEKLKSLLGRNPSHPLLKRRLSSAYLDRVTGEYSADSRIRFYEIALSFNPMNAAAREGLARAYRDAGDTGNEKRVEAEGKRAAWEAGRALSRVINELPRVTGLPRIVGDTLFLHYRTRAETPAAREAEMRGIAARLREARNFEEIRITAQGRAGGLTLIF
jgi:hypothetical protein